MTDEFVKKKSEELAQDLFHGMSVLVTTGTGVKEAFMATVPIALAQNYERQGELYAALSQLLTAPGDHMTACDRTMGDSHPCTCGADKARKLLNTAPAYN